MKHLSTLIILIVAAMLVGACGAEPPPPTVNPADVAGTAQAAALTIVAQTQAAIPTNTLPPPTEIPTQTAIATNTQLVLPTQEVAALPSPTTAPAGGDPCATRVLGKPKGKPTIIRIWNSTKVPITVSLYLNETEGHGECGYRSYKLAKNADVVITDLVYGCYNLWAWSDAPGGKFNSSGYGCVNNPDKWTFEVTTAVIKALTP
jgi:hypothetical protein